MNTTKYIHVANKIYNVSAITWTCKHASSANDQLQMYPQYTAILY